MKKRPPFWKDTLKAWVKLNYSEDISQDQFLWYNSNIVIGGKSVFYKNCYERGLKWCKQLTHQGSWISYYEAKDRFGLSVMKYNSLKAAIGSPCVNNSVASMMNVKQLLAKAKPAAYAYKMLNGNTPLNQTKIAKWQSLLHLEADDWLEQFRRLYRITNIPKLQSFHFRSLHLALVTNMHLFRWGIKSSNRCTFCDLEKETLSHLFSECHIVGQFWNQVLRWTEQQYGIVMQLNIRSIMLCDLGTGIADLIGLLAKQYIYANKCLNKSLSIKEFSSKVLMFENTEKYIAKKNNKLAKHYAKWQISDEDFEPVFDIFLITLVLRKIVVLYRILYFYTTHSNI